MKGFVKFLCSGLLVLLMLVGTGNAVFADENCTCHDLVPLEGVERNKIVADTLKSVEYKSQKSNYEKQGYTFMGADLIEVIKFPHTEGIYMVGVPFVNGDGEALRLVFIGGIYGGEAPFE